MNQIREVTMLRQQQNFSAPIWLPSTVPTEESDGLKVAEAKKKPMQLQDNESINLREH